MFDGTKNQMHGGYFGLCKTFVTTPTVEMMIFLLSTRNIELQLVETSRVERLM